MGDYPINTLFGIVPFMYSSPYFGYANACNGYATPSSIGMYINAQQQIQAANIAQLQSRIIELQMQQCCCQQLPVSAQASMHINNTHIGNSSKEEECLPIVYKLDKIIFPENPIRDYTEVEVAKVKSKYAERIKQLDALVV